VGIPPADAHLGGVNSSELIGWASSIILVLTIGKQVHKQWKAGSSEGVSKWLFVGQIAASTGFTVYSWLVRNWVFVVTNALMLLNAFVGLAIVRRHRRRERAAGGPKQASAGRAAHAAA
jgi:MtN3 and saliva related transmembrane protein